MVVLSIKLYSYSNINVVTSRPFYATVFIMSIHLAIMAVLEARNYPIAQFARTIGMNRGYVYKIVHGEVSPTLHTLERLAAGLDMKLSELFALQETIETMQQTKETFLPYDTPSARTPY